MDHQLYVIEIKPKKSHKFKWWIQSRSYAIFFFSNKYNTIWSYVIRSIMIIIFGVRNS